MTRLMNSVLAVTALATAASAQEASPFNSGDCPERAGGRWCASKATQQGWALKYKSQSPENIADAYWRIEVWTRNREAMLCELRGGRGGIRDNRCEPLQEVAR